MKALKPILLVIALLITLSLIRTTVIWGKESYAKSEAASDAQEKANTVAFNKKCDGFNSGKYSVWVCYTKGNWDGKLAQVPVYYNVYSTKEEAECRAQEDCAGDWNQNPAELITIPELLIDCRKMGEKGIKLFDYNNGWVCDLQWDSDVPDMPKPGKND